MANDKPLLQEGKKSLPQRVLSTPSCKLADKAGGSGKAVPAFSRYYVYERQQVAGSEWIKVGADESGKIVGWLDNHCAVPWNTQMALVFTNPVNRDLTLFFGKDHKADLNALIDADNNSEQVAKLRETLKSKGSAPGIVAQEPAEYIDFTKNFYLLPILEGEEVMDGKGFYERVLRVASVTKDDKKNPVSANDEKSKQNAKANNKADDGSNNEITGFNAAVVFVIDSTISMDPYINRTREAVKQLYKKIEANGLKDQVKFGLVAFRSSTQAVPGLEFVSKKYVDPNDVKDGDDFMKKVADLKQAKVSSKEFSEDAYAGVSQAIDDINWNGFGGRYIVLITDAGAIESDNPISTTKMNAEQLRLEAQRKGIALYTLHLKTPSGAKNHEKATEQYNSLSFNNYLNKPLYYPVNAGDVNEFGKKVSLLADSLTKQVKLAYKGEQSAGSALNAEETKPAKSTQTAKDEQTDIEQDAALLGKAMRLAYLGREQGKSAPPVFEAWISDRDLVKSDVPTAEVRVLLTKAQLSDLSEVVSKIMDAATQGMIQPNEMFNQLRSLAATMGQDASKIKQGDAVKLSELGLFDEYLAGIPYRSQVTGLDEESWKAMSGLQQEKFIRDLNAKLKLYQKYNANVDNWISLSEGADPKDNVYPVELEALP
ncbi:vWA domain-containing protein [Lonepinella sp. BR2474]|uniref:vWA domain-containing protein n=1 Tax=Lonepinella sp. BR2474 TaxID=3434548 RepID=UPI003F6E35B6